MAKKDDSTNLTEMLQAISGEKNPLLEMLKWMCQQMMELEVSRKINAEKSERTDERTGFRSGYRETTFDTRLGEMKLQIPKVRNGGYVPFFKVRRQRSEEALITVIQDIYISGVSTRKISKLVEQLGIGNITAAEVSEMVKRLDEQVKTFRTCRLDKHSYPILWVDALYEDVRVDGRIVSTAVEVVCGVNEEGHREVLAIEPVAQESKESYLALFRNLRERGLKETKLVISDAHAGLSAAIKEGFAGASWQRCKVHFMRNILAHVSQKSKKTVAADVKLIWLEPNAEQAREYAQRLIAKYGKRFPEAMRCLEDGLEDSLSFYAFPSIDQKKIASSNMIERLNEEIRRRTRVIGIFPNKDAYIRLVTCNMMEYTDDWSTGHAYITPEALKPLLPQKPQKESETADNVSGLQTA